VASAWESSSRTDVALGGISCCAGIVNRIGERCC
jgi:hypothetical protein